MKIVATVADYAALMHTGGDLERYSYIIEIPDENIPEGIKRAKEKGHHCTVSLSFLQEDEPKAKPSLNKCTSQSSPDCTGVDSFTCTACGRHRCMECTCVCDIQRAGEDG